MASIARGLACGIVLASGAAAAEPPMPTKIDVVPLPRAPRPPGAFAAVTAPSSKIIFMRRCGPGGCDIHQATADDSRVNASQIAVGTRTIGEFKHGDAVWNQLMDCVRDTYKPYGITITDVDPGSTPHYEHVVGGRPTDLREDLTNAGGVSPFTCDEIPNAITYTFSQAYPPDALQLCWTAAQETAHAFGLEHEINPGDPLTYLQGPMPKHFKASDTQCGEYNARPCQCGNATQNSYQHISAMFGMGEPTPPTITIKSPSAGKTVQPHFTVKVNADDETGIDRVELYVDGGKSAENKTAPFTLKAPDLPEGPHTIETRAFDVQQTTASAMASIDLGPPCTAASGCTDGEVCVMGGCVSGPSLPGGLGVFCQADTECLSGSCVADNTGTKACVEACDLSAGSCPDGFTCLQSSADAGVCWRDDSGGCCDAGGSPAGPTLLGFGVLALTLRRRATKRA